MSKRLKLRGLIIFIDVPVVQYILVLCPIKIHSMTRRMSPTGHVLLEDLSDRQCLLGSSLSSCNKNITYTTTYSHHYIRLYTFIYTPIKLYVKICISVIPISRNIYLGTYAFTYSCTHVLMYSYTNVLMYSRTHALMYSSS